MRQLESSLFGPIYVPLKFGTDLGAAVSDHDRDGPLFFMDRSAGNGEDDLPVYEEDFGSEVDEDETVNKGSKPAWVDDEDERTEVDILTACSVNPLPKRIGGDWQGLVRILTYKRFKSHSNPFNPLGFTRNRTRPKGCKIEEVEKGG
ncbi:hypothetical protein VPH35_035981 [Triticum aestivum]